MEGFLKQIDVRSMTDYDLHWQMEDIRAEVAELNMTRWNELYSLIGEWRRRRGLEDGQVCLPV